MAFFIQYFNGVNKFCIGPICAGEFGEKACETLCIAENHKTGNCEKEFTCKCTD